MITYDKFKSSRFEQFSSNFPFNEMDKSLTI